jgi:hypothetical protein
MPTCPFGYWAFFLIIGAKERGKNLDLLCPWIHLMKCEHFTSVHFHRSVTSRLSCQNIIDEAKHPFTDVE